MQRPFRFLDVVPALLVVLAVAPAASADAYLNYTSNRSVNGYPNVTDTTRTTGSTASNMWAMAYQEPPNEFNNGYQLNVEYFSSGSNGAFSNYGRMQVLEGSDADNVGNPDKSPPIPIAQGGRIDASGNMILTKNLYVLWEEKNGTNSQLVCGLVKDGVQEFSQGSNQTTISVVHTLQTGLLQGATSVGASALPDGTGFVAVTVKPGKTTATVTYYKWDSTVDTYSLRQTFQQDIALPTGLPAAYNGNIVCAVTRNYDNMSVWYPYRLTLAFDPCQAGNNVRTREYRLNDKMVESFYPRYFLTAVPKDNAWHSVGGAQNNAAFVTNLIPSVDGRLYVVIGENSGITLYARTGFDPATQQAQWQTSGSGELLQPYTDNIPALIYRPQFPATVNTDLVTFPVVRDQVMKNDVGRAGVDSTYLVAYEKSTALQARRRPLTPATGSVARVLGIVDGPPPIPNENYAIYAGTPTPWTSVTSDAAFNWTSTASSTAESDYQSSLTVGVEATAGVEVGVFSADLELSREMSWSHGSTYSRKTGTTETSFAKFANATTSDENGNVIVDPIGSLYCEYQTFKGYAYDFLDPSGNPLLGSQIYTQVWPDSVSNRILSYWMNPNGHQPGHLESYVTDDATRNQLRSQSTIKFSSSNSSGEPNNDGGNDHLYFGYADASTFGNSWESFTSDESKISTGTKVGESLKVSANLNFGVFKTGASVSVASETETTESRTIASDTSVGLVSECDVATDSRVPNTYRSEYFETYLLRDDNHYLQELLSSDPNSIGLVTSTWPPIGSRERAENEALKAQLIRTSNPWKVTYVLVDSSKTNALRAPVTGVTPLSPKLLAKLELFGITTTGLADLLVEKRDLDSAATTRLVTNLPVRTIFSQQREKAARLDAEIRKYFPDTAKFSRALLSLSDADVNALRQYQAACDNRDREAAVRANAGRYPAATPASIMNLPPIRNVGSRFTEVPPPG